jgi:hypothetical protein
MIMQQQNIGAKLVISVRNWTSILHNFLSKFAKFRPNP